MASLVFTDADLFRQIVAFQRGLPLPLYDIWRAHEPAHTAIKLTPLTTSTLVRKLVEHGMPAHFDLATRATFSSRQWGGGSEPKLEALPLHDVATLALQHNRPDILDWALKTENSKLGDNVQATWRDAITRNAADGDTRMLDVLKKYAPLNTPAINSIISSVSYSIKHANALRWLLDEIPDVQIPPDMMNSAINRGDLAMLEVLYAYGYVKYDHLTLGRALLTRHRDVLAFLVDKYADSLDEYSAMQLIKHTDKEVQKLVLRFADRFQKWCAKWLSDDRKDSRLADAQAWVAAGLISPGLPISIDEVAATGNFGIVQFLHEQGIATATTAAMDKAAENGHWDLFEFLHLNRSEGCTTRAMDAAIQQDNLNCVKFLDENRNDGFSTHAAQLVASNQSTSIVCFLHFHTTVTFSPTVMDEAAALGNIAIVKFLHENRSEGCTTNAMDRAAGNGHLCVLEFLHENRTEGCTFDALSKALKNGHLPVLRFLFENYPDLFELNAFNEALVTTTVRSTLVHNQLSTVQFLFDHFPHLFAQELLSDLLLGGAFDVYKDVQSRYPDNADAVISSALYEAGRSMKLETIRFVVNVLKRQDLAHRALDGAASQPHGGTEWLRAVHLVTGPESCRLGTVLLAVEELSEASPVDPVMFLIRVCCEADAKQVAIDALSARGLTAAAGTLTYWNPATKDDLAEQPLHLFLRGTSGIPILDGLAPARSCLPRSRTAPKSRRTDARQDSAKAARAKARIDESMDRQRKNLEFLAPSLSELCMQ